MKAGTLLMAGAVVAVEAIENDVLGPGVAALPIQKVSVRAASGARRSSVVWTVAPSGTSAMAASADFDMRADPVGLRVPQVLSGNWKASGTAIASIMAAP